MSGERRVLEGTASLVKVAAIPAEGAERSAGPAVKAAGHLQSLPVRVTRATVA